MGSYQQTYAATRERVGTLVRGLDDDTLLQPVPACPGWSVRDVVAHLTGIAAYVAEGRIAEITSDEGVRAALDTRRDRPIGSVLDEWDEAAPTLEAGFDAFPFDVAAGPTIGDAFIHELDLRGALGVPLEVTDPEAAAATFDYYVGHLGDRVEEAGLAAIRVVAGARDAVAGEGDPATTVRGDEIGVLRALAGRRTKQQIRALHWEGDGAPYVDLFSDYGYPDDDIE